MMTAIETDKINKKFHYEMLKKFDWLFKLRPMLLASILVRVIAPHERRRIVDTNMGIRLYIDPFTKLGRSVVSYGVFEQETVDIFHSEIKPGQVVLDIGANEGVFSALAGNLVGQNGLVIAIEPQSRLRDLIEINLRINNIEKFKVFLNAFGESEDSEGTLNLYPVFNMGASSIVRKYKFSTSRDVDNFKYISLKTILSQCETEYMDFVKVDVEGFEHKVILELLPFIKAGKIGKLFLDYHTKILKAQNLNSIDIHNSLIEHGMLAKHGDVYQLSSYVLYEYVQQLT